MPPTIARSNPVSAPSASGGMMQGVIAGLQKLYDKGATSTPTATPTTPSGGTYRVGTAPAEVKKMSTPLGGSGVSNPNSAFYQPKVGGSGVIPTASPVYDKYSPADWNPTAPKPTTAPSVNSSPTPKGGKAYSPLGSTIAPSYDGNAAKLSPIKQPPRFGTQANYTPPTPAPNSAPTAAPTSSPTPSPAYRPSSGGIGRAALGAGAAAAGLGAAIAIAQGADPGAAIAGAGGQLAGGTIGTLIAGPIGGVVGALVGGGVAAAAWNTFFPPQQQFNPPQNSPTIFTPPRGIAADGLYRIECRYTITTRANNQENPGVNSPQAYGNGVNSAIAGLTQLYSYSNQYTYGRVDSITVVELNPGTQPPQQPNYDPLPNPSPSPQAQPFTLPTDLDGNPVPFRPPSPQPQPRPAPQASPSPQPIPIPIPTPYPVPAPGSSPSPAPRPGSSPAPGTSPGSSPGTSPGSSPGSSPGTSPGSSPGASSGSPTPKIRPDGKLQPTPSPSPPITTKKPRDSDCCDPGAATVETESVSVKVFKNCGVNAKGDPIAESESKEINVLKGTSSDAQLIYNRVFEIESLQCFPTTAIAAVPEWWQIRAEAQRPQLVILFAEVFSSGKLGRSRWTLSIPHYRSKQKLKPNVPSYLKGSYEGILVLTDNSKIIVNAKTLGECKRVMNTLKTNVNVKYRTANGKAIKAKFGERTNSELKECRVIPVRADYFGTGMRNLKPDWTINLRK